MITWFDIAAEADVWQGTEERRKQYVLS